MSDTEQPPIRDHRGKLLPGNAPPGGHRYTKNDIYRTWSDYDNLGANKIIKDACRSEAPEVLPKLKALVDDPRPRVSILAMEAILRLAYGKPSVARLVRHEVYRLTGRSIPYTTIRSWPDGKLKDLGSPESADLLDTTGPDSASLRPSISTYDPPLDPAAVNQQQIEAKRAELRCMDAELAQATADLRELGDTVRMAREELAEMEAAQQKPEPSKEDA